MGCLTAGMLSVQFPPPRQNCDLLEVLFSVVWPSTSEPVPRSSGTASLGFPRCFTRVVWSQTSIWDVGEFFLSNFSKQFSQICVSYCIQACFSFLMRAETFPVFVWDLDMWLIRICPLSDIISAVRRLWESSTWSRGWSLAHVKTKWFAAV